MIPLCAINNIPMGVYQGKLSRKKTTCRPGTLPDFARWTKEARQGRTNALFMDILQTITLILFSICAIALIFLVMLQSGKGGGLNLVGGGNTGMQPTTVDPITKITWIAGAVFFLLAIGAAIVFADIGPGKIDADQSDDASGLPVDGAAPVDSGANPAVPANKDAAP
ncbi:MAG: preprotein translocase subunit SecG [Leptospiraceae bacterium]|nr:preprotein translocase subunit SecG [Leptospiraceae bacterium]